MYILNYIHLEKINKTRRLVQALTRTLVQLSTWGTPEEVEHSSRDLIDQSHLPYFCVHGNLIFIARKNIQSIFQ